MSGKNFDVFISYRRSDGDAIARILNAEFALRDFRCFLDFDSLGGGKFDEKIEAAILDAPVFVMVLTPDYFSRCNDKGDWVRREIELALANNKIIVPINYDKNLNGIPDYLEEDFKARIGCHNFATVHKDDTFKSSFNQMVEERNLKVVGKIVEQEHKAKVSVKSDADCELIEDYQVIATVQKDKTNFILLEKGEHEITARSSDYKDIRQEIAKNIDDVSAKYIIKIELADEENKRRQEAERIEREKREAERREQRAEEERRWIAERERERREQRAEEARRWIAENERRKAERKAWWKRNRSKFLIALAVIALSVTGLSIYLNWDYSLKTLTGHSEDVFSVCWSPDGKYLASGSWDKTVKIWDAKSGEKLKTLAGHYDNVRSVSWSPDGKYLASGSEDNTVIIWDAMSGEKLKTLAGHYDNVYSVSWSPDGKYLASGSLNWGHVRCVGELFIWDAKSGEKLKTLEGHSHTVWSVCWSPDGKYLASGTGGWNGDIDIAELFIWDAKSGEKLKTLEGHSGDVNSVCWSPDGKYLASGAGDNTVIILDANSGQKLKTLAGHYDNVRSVSWSPDGNYLASGSWDETVKIWDAKSGQRLKTLYGHSSGVESVCWSPDGKYLASGSDDKTIKIWGVE